MIIPVREFTRVWWKRWLLRAWHWAFRWNWELYYLDWSARRQTIIWQLGGALRFRDECEADWYANGWWCWPWNHSVSRFKRYRKHHDLSTALRWLKQDNEINAALRGITPNKRPEGL